MIIPFSTANSVNSAVFPRSWIFGDSKFIGHIQKHFMTTSPLTHVTSGIQDCLTCGTNSCVHLDHRPDNMLFAGLQPIRKHHPVVQKTHNVLSPGDQPLSGKEGNVLFNDALNTFSYGYMASDIW